MKPIFLWSGLVGVSLLFCGCSASKSKFDPGVPVKGTVQHGGKPLPGGTITFVPTAMGGDSANGPASGTIKADGTYEAMVPPGSYKVTVNNSHLKQSSAGSIAGGMPGVAAPPQPPSASHVSMGTLPGMSDTGTAGIKYVAINAKYSKPDSTDLTTTVPDGGATYNVELK